MLMRKEIGMLDWLLAQKEQREVVKVRHCYDCQKSVTYDHFPCHTMKIGFYLTRHEMMFTATLYIKQKKELEIYLERINNNELEATPEEVERASETLRIVTDLIKRSKGVLR